MTRYQSHYGTQRSQSVESMIMEYLHLITTASDGGTSIYDCTDVSSSSAVWSWIRWMSYDLDVVQ